MNDFTTASEVIKGNPTMDSQMWNLAEAFNSRIKEGAADSHWRIPYGILNSLFAMPIISQSTSEEAPYSAFFDFYQFIYPNRGSWPEGAPNTDKGANLINNPLNKFLFGIDLTYKDSNDSYIFDKEDVRASKLNNNFNSSTNAICFSSNGFTIIGGSFFKDTPFEFARSVNNPSYLEGSQSYTGNYYGGYFGNLNQDGYDSVILMKNNSDLRTSYTGITRLGVVNDRIYLEKSDQTILGPFRNSEYHISQFKKNIYLKRESRNHILRVLYFYITHAIGFDFDWFFNNQYAYAPELGSFLSLEYEEIIGENSKLLKSEIKNSSIGNVRLILTIDSDDASDQSFNFNTDINYKVIDDGASFTKTTIDQYNNGQQTITITSDKEGVVNILRFYGFFLGDIEFSNSYLYKYNENGTLSIPDGFVLHRLEITGLENLSSFSLKINEQYNVIKFSNKDQLESHKVREGVFSVIVSLPSKVTSVYFSIHDIIRKDTEKNFKINISPIFVLKYKPNLEDAYAIMRATCFYGDNDADFNLQNHPFNRTNINKNGKYFCQILSDDLKKCGIIKNDSKTQNPSFTYGNIDPHINQNGVFEAARLQSLNVRIIRPQNFLHVEEGDGVDILKFKASLGSEIPSLGIKIQQNATTTTDKKHYNKAKEGGVQIKKELEEEVENFFTSFEANKTTGFLYYENIKYYSSYEYLEALQNPKSSNVIPKNGTAIEVPGVIAEVSEITYLISYDVIYKEYGEGSSEYYYLQFEDRRGNRYKNNNNEYFLKKYNISGGYDPLQYGEVVYDIDEGYIIEKGEKHHIIVYKLERQPERDLFFESKKPTNDGQLYLLITSRGGLFFYEDESISKESYYYNIDNQNLALFYKSEDQFPIYITNSLTFEFLNSPTINNNGEGALSMLIGIYNKIYNNFAEYHLHLDKNAATNQRFIYDTSKTFENKLEITVDEYNSHLAGYAIYFPLSGTQEQKVTQGGSIPEIQFTYKNINNELETKSIKFSTSTYSELFYLPRIADLNDLTYKIIGAENILNVNANTANYLGHVSAINYAKYGDYEFTDNNLAGITRGSDIFNSYGQKITAFRDEETPYLFQGIAGIKEAPEGIVEASKKGEFTNEWIMWINFLPFSSMQSNTFKTSAYAEVVNPFVDRCHVNNAILKGKNQSPEGIHLGPYDRPVSPPAYRYLPFRDESFDPPVVTMSNTPSSFVDDNNQENTDITDFFKSCKASVKPYVVKSAKFNNDAAGTVSIKLDRKLEGNIFDNFRNDANGIADWLGDGAFRTGDASLTNYNNFYINGSGRANGFKGSFYPVFIFVKLIPKPHLDNNNYLDSTDSLTDHSIIKQAEWYLDIMREGFCISKNLDESKDICKSLGAKTPPDYSYSHLLYTSSRNNRLPLTSFDRRSRSTSENSLMHIYFDHNPLSYGAIPQNGMYSEYFNTLVKSVNNLKFFRVSFPTFYSYKEIHSKTTQNGTVDDCGAFVSSGEPTPTNIYSTASLRGGRGELISLVSSSSQGYSEGEQGWNNAYFSEDSTTHELSISKTELNIFKKTAYSNIENLIDGANQLAAVVIKEQEVLSYKLSASNANAPEDGYSILESETNCGSTPYLWEKHNIQTISQQCLSLPNAFSITAENAPSPIGTLYKLSNLKIFGAESTNRTIYQFQESGFIICGEL